MGLVSQALLLVDSVMTMVLTHCSLNEQGTYLLFQAKCKIYQSHQSVKSTSSNTLQTIQGTKNYHLNFNTFIY